MKGTGVGPVKGTGVGPVKGTGVAPMKGTGFSPSIEDTPNDAGALAPEGEQQ